MERVRRTYGKNENTLFVWESMKESGNLEDMDADRG